MPTFQCLLSPARETVLLALCASNGENLKIIREQASREISASGEWRALGLCKRASARPKLS